MRLDTDDVKRKYRYLFEGYTESCYYWEFVQILKKTLIITIIVANKEMENQIFFASIVIFLGKFLFTKKKEKKKKKRKNVLNLIIINSYKATLIHGVARPFEHKITHRLEFLSLIVLFLTLVSGLTYGDGVSNPTLPYIDYIVFIWAWLVIALFILCMIHASRTQVTKVRIFNYNCNSIQFNSLIIFFQKR